MLKRIVVPLDGSEFSTTAVPTALAIAHASGAGISLVGVVSSHSQVAWMKGHVEDALRLLPPTVAGGQVDIIVDADPVDVLLEIAREPGNVLCLASHDHRREAAAVRRSVGSRVIERATHPFLVVGASAGAAPPSGDVVAALDGDDRVEPLLTTAATWAQELSSRLRLVTVFEPILPDLRNPSHYTRAHGPSGDPAVYLEVMRRRVDETADVQVDAVPIPDPVGVVSGLAHHLAERPGLLLVVGRGSSEAIELRAGVVRGVLRTARVPLLVLPTSGPRRSHRASSAVAGSR
jgi:nucleotide-binding universal stress UspA family protein